MRNTVTVLMVLLVAIAGCSYLYDKWPAQIPKDTREYIDLEPNQVGWESIGKLKEFREECITKHLFTQSDLNQQINLDNIMSGRAIDQATINIQTSEAERQQIVGTIQNPGWLLSFLLPAAGGLAGRAITKLTHYSEDELKQELEKASHNTTTTPA